MTLEKKAVDAPTDSHLSLLKLLFQGQSGKDEAGQTWRSFMLQKETEGSMNMYVGKTIRLSDLKKNQSKRRRNHKLIASLKSAVKKDLVEGGFLERRFKGKSKSVDTHNDDSSILKQLRFTIPFVLVVGILAVFINSWFIGVLAIFAAVIISFFERRTQKGYEALDHLKGFKDFLSVTEKERYTFHNAPAKNPEQFMEYLPYAIAFGVEKEWADVFKDLQIATPDWYSTTTPGQTFSAGDFASELGAFSTALASSGSISSGSGGGGSAGGGSGGGGGGSW